MVAPSVGPNQGRKVLHSLRDRVAAVSHPSCMLLGMDIDRVRADRPGTPTTRHP
jgi:hypothetical protein